MARPARPLAPARREALVDAATRAFIGHGYEGASLNAILAEAGLAKSSFYHHLGDKSALFDAAFRSRLSTLEALVSIPAPADLDAESFWPAVDNLLGQLSVAAEADPRTLEAGRLAHIPDAPAVESIIGFRAALVAWADTVLRHGRSLGCVDDTVPVDLQRSLAVTVVIEIDRWAVAGADVAAGNTAAAVVLRRLLST